MLQRFLLLWLVLSSLLAYSWPRLWSALVVWSGVTLDPTFDLFQVVYDAGALKPIIRVTMFCIGCLLPREIGRASCRESVEFSVVAVA